MGKKECPTCRGTCANQRHLRPDPRFDELVQVLYPDLEAHEEEQEKMIEEVKPCMSLFALFLHALSRLTIPLMLLINAKFKK